jgi:hypothetical protein
LDDKQVFDCEVADSLAGYIIQQRRHPLFKTVMADRNGKIVTRLVKGVVRIERK